MARPNSTVTKPQHRSLPSNLLIGKVIVVSAIVAIVRQMPVVGGASTLPAGRMNITQYDRNTMTDILGGRGHAC